MNNSAAAAQAALQKALASARKINATPGIGVEDDAHISDQSTKHARKIYAGNLPSEYDLSDEHLMEFFNTQLERLFPVKEPGNVVVHVYIGPGKKYAFIEHRSITEATYVLTLDGLFYEGNQLKLRRPQDYNAQLAEDQQKMEVKNNLPGTQLHKYLQTQQITNPAEQMGIISTTVDDGPNKIFVGGLPLNTREEDIKRLLLQYGPLKGFHLVREKDPLSGALGKCKGYAFCEYRDPLTTDSACIGLNGVLYGDKPLAVRRALQKPGMVPESLAITGSSSMLSLTQGGASSALSLAQPIKIPQTHDVLRYGYMGNLGAEAVTTYMNGKLPFQGTILKELPETLMTAPPLLGGYENGIEALYGNENEWLKYCAKEGTPDELETLRKKLLKSIVAESSKSKYGTPSRVVAVKNVIRSSHDSILMTTATNNMRNLIESCICPVRYILYHPVDGGVLLVEMDDVYQAYRVLRSLHGREYFGKPIHCNFIDMPPDIKLASQIRIKNQTEFLLAMDVEKRQMYREKERQRDRDIINVYRNKVRSKWTDAYRLHYRGESFGYPYDSSDPVYDERFFVTGAEHDRDVPSTLELFPEDYKKALSAKKQHTFSMTSV